MIQAFAKVTGTGHMTLTDEGKEILDKWWGKKQRAPPTNISEALKIVSDRADILAKQETPETISKAAAVLLAAIDSLEIVARNSADGMAPWGKVIDLPCFIDPTSESPFTLAQDARSPRTIVRRLLTDAIERKDWYAATQEIIVLASVLKLLLRRCGVPLDDVPEFVRKTTGELV